VGDEIVTYHPLTGRRGPQIQPSAFNVSSAQALQSLDRLEGVEADVLLSGHVVFYNEAAGELLGRRFEETGRLSREEWSEIGPFDEDGNQLDWDALPL